MFSYFFFYFISTFDFSKIFLPKLIHTPTAIFRPFSPLGPKFFRLRRRGLKGEAAASPWKSRRLFPLWAPLSVIQLSFFSLFSSIASNFRPLVDGAQQGRQFPTFLVTIFVSKVKFWYLFYYYFSYMICDIHTL